MKRVRMQGGRGWGRAIARAGWLLPALALLVAAACNGDDDALATPTPGELSGGVLATFDVLGDTFTVWVTNEQTIEEILALRDGTSEANIPNAALREGPGEADHNSPWSWHMDPEDIHMAEMTIELCDGEPSFVEENLEYFIESVERYCPWPAQLQSVEDLR